MRRPAAGAGLAAALVLCGCGVTAEGTPRVITSRDASPTATPTASPGTTTVLGGEETTIYLVRGGNELVQSRRVLTADPTPDQLLQALVAGPEGSEGQSGLSTAVQVARVVPGPPGTPASVVTVDVPESSRTDENLAFGQIVLTLTRTPTVAGVQFQRDGKVIEVPRDDGTLDAGPLTRADYQGLLGEAG